MQDVIPDLWPDEIRSEVPTPLAILRIQASNLRNKTRGVIDAQVQSLTDNVKEREIYHFELIAPALDGYTIRLFSADHKSSLVYPIEINWHGFERGFETASAPEEMYNLLQHIFRSNETRAVLMSLIARSNERQSGAH